MNLFQILLVVAIMPCVAKENPRSHPAFAVSLDSFNLKQFLILFLKTWINSKITGELFWRISLNLGSFDAFSWLDSDKTCFGRNASEMKMCYFQGIISADTRNLLDLNFSLTSTAARPNIYLILTLSGSVLNRPHVLSHLIYHICFYYSWTGIQTTGVIKIQDLNPSSFLLQMLCSFHFIYKKESY